jgi:N-acyl-D-aspartate/D-glutamate deacylase
MRWAWWVLAGILIFCGCAYSQDFDLLILNGSVVDGSGRPAFRADVAVRQDRIAAIGNLRGRSARRQIDVSGLTVSPGFIDIHSHSDYTLLVDGTAQSKIRQGVTTEILGEAPSAGPIQGKATLDLSDLGLQVDGRSLGQYFQRLQKSGMSVNVGSYVGATQVRRCVLGEDSRKPTPQELAQMKQLVTEAMRDGALGLSSSLIVPPDTYLTTDELIALASAVKPFGGIYSTHIRGEGKPVFDAIREAIHIGETAGVPVDIIHLKIADKQLWGQMERVCALIEGARNRGLKVTANQYPYVAGQNFLIALMPPWVMEGGLEKLLDRLRQPAMRARVEHDIYHGVDGWFDHYLAVKGWESIIVAEVRNQKNRQFEGKSVAEIATQTHKRPADVVFDLILDDGGPVSAVYFQMSEEDVRYAMRMPWLSIGSDGEAVRPDGILGRGKPHPRWYGTFPRILGKYVREEKVLTLEDAVRKMTSLNAAKLGIEDRGLLQQGKLADITIFDAGRVIDKATFENPHQYPVGIEYVVVNGKIVLDKSKHLGTKPGRIIYGKGHGA